MKYYLLEVFGGVEITLHGPYPTQDKMFKAARKLHAEQDPVCDSLFYMTTRTKGRHAGNAYVGSFSSSFFTRIVL